MTVNVYKTFNFRKHSCPVDEVVFIFTVLEDGDQVEDGCYGVHGLYLEGARWDNDNKVLAESLPKVQYTQLPTVQLKPVQAAEDDPEHPGYKCPVYVTQVGVLKIVL